MKAFGIGLGIAALLGLLIFLITDLAMGESMLLECSVTGRYYVPPQTTVTTDGDGNISIDTDPEEFHVTVDEVYESRAWDISTTHHLYLSLTNGQIVRVQATLGRWTHSIHIGAIKP